MEERCDNCRFWSPLSVDPDRDGAWCRRYPPKRLEIEDIESCFPLVEPNEWCGEWKTKEDSDVRTVNDDPIIRIRETLDNARLEAIELDIRKLKARAESLVDFTEYNRESLIEHHERLLKLENHER